MALNIWKFFKGIRLVPKGSSDIANQGEMEVLSTDGKLGYHNGTTVSNVVTEKHASQDDDRLENKDLDDTTTAIVHSSDTTSKIKFNAAGATGTSTTITSSQTVNRVITLPDVAGTLTTTGNKLSDFAATTSAELAGVISDETGSGKLVFDTSPTLVTPTLGAASATSINKVALTAPATGSTLTIADGKTLTVNNTMTLAADADSKTLNFGANNLSLDTTGDSTLTLPTTGTLATLAGSEALTNKTIDGDLNTVQDLALTSLKTNLTDASKFVVRDADGIVVSNTKAVPTGVVVGTTDTQTLTGKTIDGDDNTVQDLPLTAIKTVLGDASKFLVRDASGVPASSKSVPTGDVVGSSDTQILTNKTIDANSNTISNLAHGSEVDNPTSGVHGVTGSVVGTSDTQTLTAKTFDDALGVKQITTPSNPSAGYNKVYPKSDNKFYILDSSGNEKGMGGLSAWATSTAYAVGDVVYHTDQEIYECLSAHTSGTFLTDRIAAKWERLGQVDRDNYVLNGRADINVTGWSASSANITIARNTTTPISGDADFLITISSSATTSDYVQYGPITIDKNAQANILNILASYYTAGVYTDGMVGAYFYDDTNSALVYPADQSIPATSLVSNLSKGVQVPADCTTGYIRFKVESVPASDATIYIDNIEFKKKPIVKGSFIGDWISYTPTFSAGLSGVAAQEFWYKIEGSDVLIKGSATFTGTASTVLTMSLPAGVTIDTAFMQTAQRGRCGRFEIATGTQLLSSLNQEGVVFSDDTDVSNVFFTIQGSSTGYVKNQGSQIVATAAGWISLECRFKAQGKSSNMTLSEDSGNRLIAARAYRNGALTLAPNNSQLQISLDTIERDETASYSTSGGYYELPENGWYSASAGVYFDRTNWLANQYYAFISKGSDFATSTTVAIDNQRAIAADGSTTYYAFNPVTTGFYGLKGQRIYFGFFGRGNNSVSTLTVTVGTQVTWFSINKISSPQTIAASEKVEEIYTHNVADNITNGGSVIMTTKVKSTHGAYNTTTGTFTSPRGGLLKVSAIALSGIDTTIVASETISFEAVVNGASTIDGPRDSADSAANRRWNPSSEFKIPVNKGDTVLLRFNSTVGSAITYINSGIYNRISFVME